jgi:hypothetical protein
MLAVSKKVPSTLYVALPTDLPAPLPLYTAVNAINFHTAGDAILATIRQTHSAHRDQS